MPIDTQLLTLGVPVIINALMILWTAFAPFLLPQAYGDWLAYPVLIALPAVILWHIGLVVFPSLVNVDQPTLLIYGLTNSITFFLLWVMCVFLGKLGPPF